VTSLETDRLILRPYAPSDEPAYLAMVGDPEVMRHLPGGQPMTPEQGRAAFQRRLAGADPSRHHFALVEKTTDQVVGWVGLMHLEGTGDVEVYYGLRRDAWGKGYATEAARRLVRWGMEELHLSRVVAVVDPANARSAAVLQRLGMRFERVGAHYGKTMNVYATSAAPAPAPEPQPAWSAPLPPPRPAAPAFCAACGAALAQGASFCGHCGRPVLPGSVPGAPGYAIAPGLAPPPPAALSAKPTIPQGTAIVALLLNIFVWPGLGSLVAGRSEGWAQGVLALAAVLVLVFTLGLGFFLAIPMWLGAWIWGIVTGAQLLGGTSA
jgi:RimJ/RimL family protein N-acetyltransferase